KVKLKTGKKIEVQFPAWVLVGPPDYAPEIRSVVSLYDTLLDVAIRELPDPTPPFYTTALLTDYKAMKASLGGAAFQARFSLDIEPPLVAAAFTVFVHKPLLGMHFSFPDPVLKSPAPADQPARNGVWKRLRPPGGNTTYTNLANMPRLYG